MADPFDEAYEKFKNVPTETLKKNIAAHVYGERGRWTREAAEYIIKEREEAEQREKFDRDFNLTQQNITATKEMVTHTKSLASATWVLAVVTTVLVVLTWFRK